MRIDGALNPVIAILHWRLHAWMRIAIATRNRPCDVTTVPADVSKCVMDMVLRNHDYKLYYNTTNAALYTLE